MSFSGNESPNWGLGGRVEAYFHANKLFEHHSGMEDALQVCGNRSSPLLPLTFPSLPLEVGPLATGRESGERFSTSSGSGRSPAAKRYLVNFRLKILPLVATIFRSFSGNETSKWGTIGGRVVTYLCKQIVWTSQWHGRRLAMMLRHKSLRRFALHIIFCLDLNWGGGSCSPASSSNDAPARTGHVTSSTTRPLCSPYAISYRCSTAGSVDVLRDTLVWAGIGMRSAA